jgi:hypothetical protein
VSEKRHLLTGFIAFLSVRVIPCSNDTDCHHHLQIGDSPTPSGAKNVNMLNRIDRKKCLERKTSFYEQKPYLLTGFSRVKVIPQSNDTGCLHLLEVGIVSC